MKAIRLLNFNFRDLLIHVLVWHWPIAFIVFAVGVAVGLVLS